ncbi:MAG: hypothetical protein ACI8PZ_002178 [Myxococcota bacterium]
MLLRRYANGQLGIDASGDIRWPDDSDTTTGPPQFQTRLAINDHYNENDTDVKWPGVRDYMGHTREDTLVLNFASIAWHIPNNTARHYADIMNPLISDYLSALGAPLPSGVVVMDFVTASLIQQVVRMNFVDAAPAANIRWFEKNDCTGSSWDMPPVNGYAQDLKDSSTYPNDEFRSVQLQNLSPGWTITVYDSPSASTGDDWCTIEVKSQTTVYNVDSFETDVDDSFVTVTFHKKNGLDGKVSYVKISK